MLSFSKLSLAFKQNTFISGLTFICLCYLGFQLFYTYFATLSVDEFWFAHRIYQYKDSLPYRDFAPYKTVLGYYLLLFPMTLSHELLTPLFHTKNVLALLNSLLFFISAIWLKRHFPKFAVLSSLTLLISTEMMLSYSTNIRVDFLAYWFCLFSVLLLLEKKWLLAGLILSLGFSTSQKVIWYIAASDIALGLSWLCLSRNRATFWSICLFNLAILTGIIIYLLFWGWLTNFAVVLKSVFYEAYVMYKLDFYAKTRFLFWSITLVNNPLLFLLSPLTLITLLIKPDNDDLYQKRFFATIYGLTILLCLIPYKQIFPYYMLTTMPAFFLLYAAFFSWLLAIFNNPKPAKLLWGLLFAYLFVLAWLILFFELSRVYLLIGLIPVLLGFYLTSANINTQTRSLFFTLITLVILFTGIIYPLITFTGFLSFKNGDYQKSNLLLLNHLLQDNSDYLAGIELIYDKNQPIPGLRHLDAPMLGYLYQPREKLRPAMLASLYHTPAITAERAVEYLKNSSVKLYVNSYRIHFLPPLIKNYLTSQYEHLWGSIYLYAPTIHSGKQTMQIKFTGNYRVESSNPVFIDQRKIAPSAFIKLTKGIHQSNAVRPYRLKLMPEDIKLFLNPLFQKDNWENMLS